MISILKEQSSDGIKGYREAKSERFVRSDPREIPRSERQAIHRAFLAEQISRHPPVVGGLQIAPPLRSSSSPSAAGPPEYRKKRRKGFWKIEGDL